MNHDTLTTAGVLDLKYGPRVLRVPDMAGRYYSVQFIVRTTSFSATTSGKRTGTNAGSYLITGPGWKGEVPSGMKHISSPANSVFILGRTLVYNESDIPRAYNLAKEIQLTA